MTDVITPENEAFLRDLTTIGRRSRQTVQHAHYFGATGLDTWTKRYCQTCVHDTNEDCPHVNALLTDRPDHVFVYVAARSTWHCTEYTPRTEKQ